MDASLHELPLVPLVPLTLSGLSEKLFLCRHRKQRRRAMKRLHTSFGSAESGRKEFVALRKAPAGEVLHDGCRAGVFGKPTGATP